MLKDETVDVDESFQFLALPLWKAERLSKKLQSPYEKSEDTNTTV